jgi:hypothetical protein
MSTTPTSVTLSSFVLSHAIWIVALAVALLIGHTAIQEHDARVLADAQIKTAQATIQNLQSQIATTNAQAAASVRKVSTFVRNVSTPAQAVPAIPELTNMPLQARPAVDNPAQVSVDAIPLVQLLGQAKEDEINLGACQADLKSETAIAQQKDQQIAALKKKPKFWTRVRKDLEIVGVGVVTGLVLAEAHK